MLKEIKEWLQQTKGKGGIARRDHIEWLVAELDRVYDQTERTWLEKHPMLTTGSLADMAERVTRPLEEEPTSFIGLGHMFTGGKVPDQFLTRQGDPAAQAHDGDWLQPTVNPFGHGCCDCSLFHSVEWRLVNDNGEVHDVDFLSMAAGPGYGNGINLQLRFIRDEGETVRLRAHKGEK